VLSCLGSPPVIIWPLTAAAITAIIFPSDCVGFRPLAPSLVELPHSLNVSDRRRNTLKSAHNRSESLCAGLSVPCRIFWAWFGRALGFNSVRSRFLAWSFEAFGALWAQPSSCGEAHVQRAKRSCQRLHPLRARNETRPQRWPFLWVVFIFDPSDGPEGQFSWRILMKFRDKRRLQKRSSLGLGVHSGALSLDVVWLYLGWGN
jgi:hypothetical protein